MIEKSRDGRSTQRLCQLLGVSRSGFYAWLDRPDSNHKRYDKVLRTAIKELHQGFRQAYGAPRMHRLLRQKGYDCSVRRVNRLMRELGLEARARKVRSWRGGDHGFYSVAQNLLPKASPPVRVGEAWAGDFTYVRTGQGWLYHAVMMDLYSRRIVGWSFSRQRSADLTKSALQMALDQHPPRPGCLVHSDQGIEYAAQEYAELVASADLVRSMSRKGNPLDNAQVESFFHSLKTELVHRFRFETHAEAVAQIRAYIAFYNRERMHSSLGYTSPMEYEKQCA
ncbi:MAG: IS3 family transposase [Halieaceae bacterium]